MEQWPPAPPSLNRLIGPFSRLTEHVRIEAYRKPLSATDRSLAQYMRSKNVGTRLLRETDGPHAREFVALFDTATARSIRQNLLNVLHPSTEEDDVYVFPTDVTHAALNALSKKDAHVLADELVGGYYEQYDIAQTVGISKKELRKISPERYEEQLEQIYDAIRNRVLRVIEIKK